jgi:hypothetical protein
MSVKNVEAKLGEHLFSGGCRLGLIALTLSCMTALHAATYTMSGSSDIPLVDGAYSFADWSFTNLPRGKKATVQVQGDAVVVTVADAGMMLIFR